MNKPPELFAPERPVRSDFARQRGVPYALRRMITLLVLVCLFGAGIAWLWHHMSSGAPGEIPTVKAEGAYKQRPDQPGGIDIPHQDVQVYHEIDGSAAAADTKPGVEHMLPPPEEPMSSTLPAKPATAMTSLDNIMSPPVERLTTTVTGDATEPAPPVSTPIAVQATSVSVQPQQATLAPQPQAAPIAPVASQIAAPPPQISKPTLAVKGGTVVQLAAVPDEQAAGKMAKNLHAKYAAILGDADLHPVRADLGAKGIFYRIQSQQLNDAQARSICAAIKNQNGGCILVHP